MNCYLKRSSLPKYWLPWSLISLMFCTASRSVSSLSDAILKDLTPMTFFERPDPNDFLVTAGLGPRDNNTSKTFSPIGEHV
jgi:hypothetical protein